MKQKQKLRYSKYLKERKGQYLALLLAYLCVIISQLLIPQQVSKMLSCITAEGVGIGLLTAALLGTCGVRVVWVLLVVPGSREVLPIIASYPLSWLVTGIIFGAYYWHFQKRKF